MNCKYCKYMNDKNQFICMNCGKPLYNKSSIPNILCGISIFLQLINILKWIYESMFNGGIFYQSNSMIHVSLLLNLLPFLSLVFVIISKVKYPYHKLSNVLLKIYLLVYLIVVVLIICFTMYCVYECQGM